MSQKGKEGLPAPQALELVWERHGGPRRAEPPFLAIGLAREPHICCSHLASTGGSSQSTTHTCAFQREGDMTDAEGGHHPGVFQMRWNPHREDRASTVASAIRSRALGHSLLNTTGGWRWQSEAVRGQRTLLSIKASG